MRKYTLKNAGFCPNKVIHFIGNTEGDYYTDPDPDKLAGKINYILNNEINTNNRQRIIDL